MLYEILDVFSFLVDVIIRCVGVYDPTDLAKQGLCADAQESKITF